MTCQDFEKSLDSYLDHALSDPETESMTEHLHACPRCRAGYEAQRTLRSVLGQLPDAELPPRFHERLHAALEAERPIKEVGHVKRKLRLPVLAGAAAGLLVLALGGSLVLGGLDLDGGMAKDMQYALEQGGVENNSSITGDDASYSGSGLAGSKATATAASEEDRTPSEAPVPEASQADTNEQSLTDTRQEQDSVAEGRMIIYTAEIGLRTRQFDADLASVRQACEAAGGYVESANVQGLGFDQTGGTGRTASITLRIPQTAYAQYVGTVAGVGQLTSRYEYTDDITADYFDSQTRLDALELQLERLEEILSKSESMEDVVLLVEQISEVTGQIEQIKGQLRLWDDLVDYSQVTVTLTEVQESTYVEPADPTLSDRMAVAFFGTLNAMKRGMQSLAVGIVGAVPYLMILAALALIAVVIIVSVRRRRRVRPLPPPEKE